MNDGFLRTYADGDLQTQMDVAVVVPTVLRPHLRQALESVFMQRFDGRIHLLIGIDKPLGDVAALDAVCRQRPSHCAVQVLWPGYSTSTRHGGTMLPGDGGALRAMLTYMANAPLVAYLDDDNWWAPEHLSQMRAAVASADWAYALRWYVHPETRRPACVDIWESVGPGHGIFNEKFGGFVDPNCLMINKLACPLAAHHWLFPLPGDPMSADRRVFDFLAKNHRSRCTGQPSVYYTLQPKDVMHAVRQELMAGAYQRAGA